MMIDIVSPEKRSRMMSAIRNKDTKPELIVRKYIHSLGFRFRLQQRIAQTRPDIILPKWRTAIFIHGCYWHRHRECKLASVPKSNTDFWKSKFADNVERDKRNIEQLESNSWAVGIIWECAVRSGEIFDSDIKSLIEKRGFWTIG